MLVWGVGERIGYGAGFCAVAGLLVGALEFAALSYSTTVPLGFGEHLLLGLTMLAMMGGGAGLLGGLLGVAVHPLTRSWRASSGLAIQLGVTIFALCALYFWPFSQEVIGQGRRFAGYFMAAFPLFILLVGWHNTGFWLRRIERGNVPKVRAWWVAGGMAVGLTLLTFALHPTRYWGGGTAIETDPNLLVITVDGLRMDHVDPYRPGTERVLTRNIAGLAERGVVFGNAVTPMPDSAPANATVMTGVHPLRHGLLRDGDRLRRGRPLADVLQAEGFATGAFVSAPHLGRGSGLEAGFYAVDDEVGAPVRGLSETVAWSLLMGTADARRDGGETSARALAFTDKVGGVPWFVWAHYDVRDVAASQDVAVAYRDAVVSLDEDIGVLIDGLEASGELEDTVIVLAGTHGENLGAHGLPPDHRGLYDDVLRVPLIIAGPRVDRKITRIAAQVRLQEVWPTMMEVLELDPKDQPEGVSLLGYSRGELRASLWTPVVGRSTERFEDGPMLGVRKDGTKYIQVLETGDEEVYDLVADPGERTNIAGDRPETVEEGRAQARQNLAAIRLAFGLN